MKLLTSVYRFVSQRQGQESPLSCARNIQMARLALLLQSRCTAVFICLIENTAGQTVNGFVDFSPPSHLRSKTFPEQRMAWKFGGTLKTQQKLCCSFTPGRPGTIQASILIQQTSNHSQMPKENVTSSAQYKYKHNVTLIYASVARLSLEMFALE